MIFFMCYMMAGLLFAFLVRLKEGPMLASNDDRSHLLEP